MGAMISPEQFIDLEVQRLAVAVLCVLDEEHHEKGDDRGARINDQLPSVAKVEDWPGNPPNDYNSGGNDKRGRPTGPSGAFAGEFDEAASLRARHLPFLAALHFKHRLQRHHPRNVGARQWGTFPRRTECLWIYSNKNAEKWRFISSKIK